jgi:hypothetical protein
VSKRLPIIFLLITLTGYSQVNIAPSRNSQEKASQDDSISSDQAPENMTNAQRENWLRKQNDRRRERRERKEYIEKAFALAGDLSTEYLLEIQKLPTNQAVKKLIDDGKLAAMLKSNQIALKRKRPQDIRDSFYQIIQHEKTWSYLRQNPKVLDGFISLFREPYPVAGLINFILDRMAHLKFFACLILSFIVSWAISGHFVSAGLTFMDRLARRVFLLGGFLLLRAGLFLFFYYPHLKGPLSVFEKT